MHLNWEREVEGRLLRKATAALTMTSAFVETLTISSDIACLKLFSVLLNSILLCIYQARREGRGNKSVSYSYFLCLTDGVVEMTI